jgi:hypothetical protein
MRLATLCIAAALPLVCSASTLTVVCPPVLVRGTTIDPACPGLGATIIDDPNTKYQVWFEDLPGGGDADYNDIAVAVNFDNGGVPFIRWLGNNSDYDDSLYLGTDYLMSNSNHPAILQLLGVFTIGQELTLNIHTPPGDIWYDGPAIRNSDDTIHAYVTGGAQAPEPTTLATLGFGMVALGISKWRKRK